MADPAYLSINEFPGDGATSQYEFNFAGGYLDKAHVKAYIKSDAGDFTEITVTPGMFITDFTLNIGQVVPVGAVLRIYRDTPRDAPMVVFEDGARITEANLDRMTRQAILAVAEAFDAGDYARANDLVGQALSAATRAEVAAGRVDLGELDAAVATTLTASLEALAASVAAVAAAADAAAAASGAFVAANVYPSIADGLAASTEGGQFQVVDADGLTVARYRKDAGPVATLVATYPSGASVAALRAVVTAPSNPPYVLDVQDGLGQTALGITPAGGVAVLAVTATEVTATEVTATDALTLPDGSRVAGPAATAYVFELVDDLGRVALGVTPEGVVDVGALTVRTINDEVPVFGGGTVAPSAVQPRYHAEVNHVITYGQSLSVGQTGGVVLSTSQPYNALKFSGGVRAWDADPGARYASLQPLTETVAGTLGETPSAGTAQAAMQLLAAAYGTPTSDASYRLLLSAPGFGGQSIAQLSKPGEHYTKLLEDIAAGYTLAQTGGYSYAVNAITWTQGEADTNLSTAPATYRASFAQLLADVSVDARAVTGQAHTVKAITYQVSSHLKYAADGVAGAESAPIGLAQLDLHIEGVAALACPTYQFDYLGATNVHLTAESSKWLGAYYGKVYKRIVVEQRPWEPLRPMSVVRQGRIITLALEPEVGPVVIDTTQVSAAANYGFQLRDAGGGALAISSVSVVGNNIKIVAAAPVPSGAQLRYAVDSADGLLGRTVGPRGNFRDSCAEVFDPSGINKPLYNWLVMFTAQL